MHRLQILWHAGDRSMTIQLYAVVADRLIVNPQRISLCSPERAGVSWSEIQGLAAHLGVLVHDGLQWNIRVFQAGAHEVAEQVWNDGPGAEARLQHTLQYEIPGSVLFMDAGVFPTFEAACQKAGITFRTHRYSG